jgi:hypothetical protein
MLQGSFDPGSSEADRFQASMKAEGETVSFPVSYSAAQGEFWSGAGGAQEPLNIYFRPDWGNNRETAITLTVSLITTDGDKVEETVEFIYSCWW